MESQRKIALMNYRRQNIYVLFLLIYFCYCKGDKNEIVDGTSTCQVMPTNAKIGSLSATYYLTAPADLHYAIVPEGYIIQDPLEIKDPAKHPSVKSFGTIRSEKPQQLELEINNMPHEIPLDAYFVAEVIDSRGVFGKIVVVRGIQAHRPPPVIKSVLVKAKNGMATGLEVNVTLDRAGEIYYIVKEELNNSAITPKDIFQPISGIIHGHNTILNTSIHSFIIENLNPKTSYKLYLVSETTASKGVISELPYETIATTHALAPVVEGVVEPQDGSSDTIIVKMNYLNLTGNLYFIVTSSQVNITNADEVKEAKVNSTILAIGQFLNAANMNKEIIKGLSPGTSYQVFFVSETYDSNGVFGILQSKSVKTHALPPIISNITVIPSLGSSEKIEFNCTIDTPGNVLYLLTSQNVNIEQTSQFLTVNALSRGNISANASGQVIQKQISGLDSSTKYNFYLVTETRQSGGLLGKVSSPILVKTHQHAPDITFITLYPKDGNTTTLLVKVQLSFPGLIHYTVNETQSAESIVTSGSFNCPQTNIHCTNEIVNLEEGKDYQFVAYTEPTLQNNVFGKLTEIIKVKTHSKPPEIISSFVIPTNSTTNALSIGCELNTKGIVHYLVIEDNSKVDLDVLIKRKNIPGQEIYRNGLVSNTTTTKDGDFKEEADYIVSGLKANTNYSVYLFTETYNSSGVFDLKRLELPPISVKTHAEAAKLEQYTAVPSNATTTGITIIVNLTQPSIVHYSIPDFKPMDPTIITTAKRGKLAIKHGSIIVDEYSVNQSIHHNVTDLIEGSIYHVHLITETINSNGVFSTPIPPVVVATHEKAPEVVFAKAFPKYGSNNSISLRFSLNRHGDFHYIVCFRRNATEKSVRTTMANVSENSLNNSTSSSTSFIQNLTSLYIKNAEQDDVIKGNGTIQVRRDQAIKRELITESISNLYSGAIYDICYTTESSGSNGVFGLNISCIEVETTMDYSSEFDYASAIAVGGSTDEIELTYILPRLVNAPSFNNTDPVGIQCGRNVYYVVMKDRSHRQDGNQIKKAIPGENSIISAGSMSDIQDGNDSFIILKKRITNLLPQTKYYISFVGEADDESGVFSPIPDTIVVETFAQAPSITNFKVKPTDGDSTNITINFRVDKEAIVHIFVLQKNCSSLPLRKGREFYYEEDQKHCLIEKREQNMTTVKDINIYTGSLDQATTYGILLLSETINSSGVFSSFTPKMNVKTHAAGPEFLSLNAFPKNGSTNEIELHYKLNQEGDLHYVICPSSSSSCNISSPLDLINSKQTDVQWKRTLRNVESDFNFLEPLSHLKPGIPYNIYILTETIDSKGVYGDLQVFENISTHKIAPRVLSHSVFPSLGSSYHIKFVFSLDSPGELHYLVTLPGKSNSDSIKNGEIGGTIVSQKTLLVEKAEEEIEEEILVPYPNTLYSLLIVTETLNSHGVFGDVATHLTVQSFPLAPEVVFCKVEPTDARTDSITLTFQLDRPGNLLYYLLQHGSKVDSIYDPHLISHGIIAAAKGNFSETYLITSLTEGTTYDLYYLSEAYESGGIFSVMSTTPLVTTTHRLPPKVLEDISCTLDVDCSKLNREKCWVETITCGRCQEGFEGKDGISNRSCVHLENPKGDLQNKESQDKKTTAMSNETNKTEEILLQQECKQACDDPKVLKELGLDLETLEQNMIKAHIQDNQTNTNSTEKPQEYPQENADTNVDIHCPPNSFQLSLGHCQCISGYDINEDGTACVHVV